MKLSLSIDAIGLDAALAAGVNAAALERELRLRLMSQLHEITSADWAAAEGASAARHVDVDGSLDAASVAAAICESIVPSGHVGARQQTGEAAQP